MSIITISRGSYSKGKEVAEKVAQNGTVYLKTESTLAQESPLIHHIEKVVKKIDGVKEVKTDVHLMTPYGD